MGTATLRITLQSRRWRVAFFVLRVAAEAGWLSVVYAAAAVLMSHTLPALGPFEIAGFVTVGLVVGRISRNNPGAGAVLLICFAIAGGVLGWLADSNVWLAMPNLSRALGLHIAGWVAAVAIIRGSVVATDERAPFQLESLMGFMPLLIGFLWAYTTFAVRPALWLPFAVGAMWGTVWFLSASLVAIGLARLEILHRDVVDAHRKRAWRWLVVAIGLGVIPIAIPLAILSGIPLSALLSPVTGPVQFGLGLLVYPLIFIVWILTAILSPIAPGVGEFLDQLGAAIAARRQPTPQESSAVGVILGLVLWTVTVSILVYAIYYIARWMLSRRDTRLVAEDDQAGGLTHEIVRPAPDAKPVAAPRKRRKASPHDVVGAYVAAVEELEKDPDYARRDSETPAQHATRLRRKGIEIAPDLGRLAAGYQLARYAERPINPFENLRAISRLQRIKRAIRS
jgi:hypothetical protein